ncbi:sigma 54-interacting transcriptional regulator, partial [Thermodesulfobacteriota bacterium]
MTAYDEQFLSRVFDSVSDPFAIYDLNFRIVRANQALLTLFNLSAEQVVGRYCYELFYNRKTMCEGCHVKTVFENGESRMLEKRIPMPDGRERIFEVQSYPIKDEKGITIQAVEHARDITERKSLEAQLVASKEFNDQIINNITDSLVVVNPGNFRILQANDSFHHRAGLKPPTAVGKRCHEIMLGNITACQETGIPCPMEETIRTKRPALSDKIYPNAEGENRMLEVFTYPILDAEGEISSIIRLERDVTEKRKMEEALAFRSKELQRTQHQLETLFETSRQVNAKQSLVELVAFVQEISQGIFPDSEFFLFLLDATNQDFLDLEGCNPNVKEPLHRMKQELKQSGLTQNFIQYSRNITEPHIIGPEHNNDNPPFYNLISKHYPSWFGLPISSPQQCIGFFALASPVSQEYSREDMHFFLTLFSQIAGHVRHLIVYESEIGLLKEKVAERPSYGKIIGQSDEMQNIYELIDLISGSDATVLITGENGTGKELVAQAIHRQSYRKDGPFVVANCSAYSPTLLESELFGHEKGAFTGAIKRKIGRIERAQKGI